jgi:hypothetical protein
MPSLRVGVLGALASLLPSLVASHPVTHRPPPNKTATPTHHSGRRLSHQRHWHSLCVCVFHVWGLRQYTLSAVHHPTRVRAFYTPKEPKAIASSALVFAVCVCAMYGEPVRTPRVQPVLAPGFNRCPTLALRPPSHYWPFHNPIMNATTCTYHVCPRRYC